MTQPTVDKFVLRIDRVDVATEGDENWSPDLIEKMRLAGFSMKGGLYVWLRMMHPIHIEQSLYSYAVVARRNQPKAREPKNAHEAGMPEFMEYCCFHVDAGGTVGWGASVVNSLIAANEGRLPKHWLDSAMSKLKTPGALN